MLQQFQNVFAGVVSVDAFLAAMQSELTFTPFQSLEDTLTYTHGSTETVGLMMASIMGLPEESFGYAKLQGRAMQWLNFIRDIKEDNSLGRQYFPQEDLKKYGLPDLKAKTAKTLPGDFNMFIKFQLERYKKWQSAASEGYKYIPQPLRVPLQTAAEKYDATAEQIAKDPIIILKRKVRPTSQQIAAHQNAH